MSCRSYILNHVSAGMPQMWLSYDRSSRTISWRDILRSLRTPQISVVRTRKLTYRFCLTLAARELLRILYSQFKSSSCNVNSVSIRISNPAVENGSHKPSFCPAWVTTSLPYPAAFSHFACHFLPFLLPFRSSQIHTPHPMNLV